MINAHTTKHRFKSASDRIFDITSFKLEVFTITYSAILGNRFNI